MERIYQGKNCQGMTPMECFEKTKHLAKIKMIGYNAFESQDRVSSYMTNFIGAIVLCQMKFRFVYIAWATILSDVSITS